MQKLLLASACPETEYQILALHMHNQRYYKIGGALGTEHVTSQKTKVPDTM